VLPADERERAGLAAPVGAVVLPTIVAYTTYFGLVVMTAGWIASLVRLVRSQQEATQRRREGQTG
jgi:hypothetical protein